MSLRIEVALPGLPAEFADWAEAEGEVVARSRSTDTVRIRLGGLDLHRKRWRYPLATALRGVLRNTLFRPSRARREYRMLGALADLDAAPAPAAFGERRVLGLLRHAFVASVTFEGAEPLSKRVPDGRDRDRALGRFLGRLHAAGATHGRLFARNLLGTPDGAFRLVDLDRARVRRDGPAPASARAKDLAFLSESLAHLPLSRHRAVLAAYGLALGATRQELRDLLITMEPRRAEARRRLARRSTK